jgi:phage gpG-like protein
MSKNFETPDFERRWERFERETIERIARLGLDFFDDSFANQGFTDTAFVPWQPKAENNGYNLLIKSGHLRSSLQVFEKSRRRIVFGSDVDYAEIHNEGGTLHVPVTRRSRKFFWFMYKATGKQFWKAMALTKKTHLDIKIPKRQFIGESATLMNQIDTMAVKQIKKHFSK